ncbi:MAG: hypothetical protein A2V81_02315 [Candidatus Abawacabacteria bacterium RBG_16_42_10]|uniref:Gas vesicle protein n=1 Tax=Candidatus Abawacabacteria bacterium RBG_16_42_10 TaxID=1817814 RepID=A0A1F4XMM3_9BACT|nr:MAG: hypothetical protein A2V81_02315 [Candidatus Abawacabacteria bacterium RBG_16_42_10]
MKKRDKFIVGTVVGGAIGSIIALMFAPKSGKETRKDIRDSSQKLIQKTSEFGDQVQKSSKSLFGIVRRWWAGK